MGAAQGRSAPPRTSRLRPRARARRSRCVQRLSTLFHVAPLCPAFFHVVYSGSKTCKLCKKGKRKKVKSSGTSRRSVPLCCRCPLWAKNKEEEEAAAAPAKLSKEEQVPCCPSLPTLSSDPIIRPCYPTISPHPVSPNPIISPYCPTLSSCTFATMRRRTNA
eukprot:2713116-Rhodomonas_salina.1